jgi:hypothetical protein
MCSSVGRNLPASLNLAGKRIGAGSFGTLPAYEVRVLIDKYRLGTNTIIVPLNSTQDRMIGTQRGTIDATVVPVPSDLKAEEMGMKRLLAMGTILQIPQAGLGDDRGKNQNRSTRSPGDSQGNHRRYRIHLDSSATAPLPSLPNG